MVLPCPSTVTYTSVTGGVGVAIGGAIGEKIVGGGPKDVVPPEAAMDVAALVVMIGPLVVGELGAVVVSKLPLLDTTADVLTSGAVLDVDGPVVVLGVTGFTVFVMVVIIVVVMYVLVIYVVGALPILIVAPLPNTLMICEADWKKEL